MRIDLRTKPWALVRVLLGFLQVVAAMTTAILLYQTGINWLTAVDSLLTMALLLTSRLLFHLPPNS